MLDEPALRSPAMCERRSPITRPIPVDPTVQRIGQAPDLGLLGRVAVEVRAHGQDACEQKGRVDRGKLTLPDAATRFDVQEMVEKALVTGGIRLGTLRTVDQVTQTLSGDLGCEPPEEDATLDDDRNGRQGHADG